jgi:hypothetical protein
VRYDDDREPPIHHEPTFPGTVRTAGIIWIIFGSMILLNLLGMLLFVFGFAVAGPGGNKEGAIVGMLCGGALMALFGGAFVYVGVQSVRGTAADTLGNGIGSIVFGLLNLGVGFLLVVSQPQTVIAGGINCLVGVALFLAGILALAGRGPYRDWREANLPQRRRRFEDDDDDRPRRPRYRDEDDYPPRRPTRREDEDRYSE